MPRLLTVGRVIGRVGEIGVNHIYDESGNVIETHEHNGEAGGGASLKSKGEIMSKKQLVGGY